MSYKIKEALKKKFNPRITTLINGVVERVSIKDLETNPQKYAKTHLISFYEDSDGIKKRLKKSVSKSAKVLNMEKVSRGDIFDENFQSPVEKSIELMQKKSASKRDRLKNKFEADQKAKAEKEAADQKKKTSTAKKSKNTSKTEEEKAIEAAIEAGKK